MQPAAPQMAVPGDPGDRLRSRLSLLALAAVLLLLAGSYLLISPPEAQTYPGAIPWSDRSLLRPIVDAMGLWGLVHSERGVEIKDFAFHLLAAAGLILLAVRCVVSARWPSGRRTYRGAWFFAQGFLAVWAALSLASASWSGDWAISLKQGLLYALMLGWALAVAWSLEGRDVPRVLGGYILIAAVGAALCLWYYHERNPHHRPGFPIGNPSTLAACTVPAALLAAGFLVGSLLAAWRQGRVSAWLPLIGSAAALLPLLWCLKITDSRGAFVGALAAVTTALFLAAGRKMRWVVAGAAVVALAAGVVYISSASNDATMARGASLRFRLYAWRYAAELWRQRAVSGIGAGAYPRLASALSRDDRVLDPGAFMGENVDHAHNELFEVFTEIGLLGGVTWVAGFLATFVAAVSLLRGNFSPQRRWLLIALTAGFVGLLAESMFGVGLRLPGQPAVFFTLLGVLWAACRAASKEHGEPFEPHELAGMRSAARRRYAAAAVAGACGLLLLGVAWRNWTGVVNEYAAGKALREGRNAAAYDPALVAEQRLLDPVRTLAAHQRIADVLYRLARETAQHWAAGMARTQSAPAATQPGLEQLHAEAVSLARRAHDTAFELNRRAPTFGWAAIIGARSAELLAVLLAQRDAEQAEHWTRQAWSAWRARHAQRPYEFDTLMALTRYPANIGDHVAMLRDALRSGFPPPEWFEALRRVASNEQFEPTLQGMAFGAGLMAPNTENNYLLLSGAPEALRMTAVWAALGGDYAMAEQLCLRAASLYAPLRSRFPELYSVAIAERAEYLLLADPGNAPQCAALLRDAIDKLPQIQEQKYDELTRPFRVRYAKYLLAAGKTAEARGVLEAAVTEPAQQRATLADLYVDLVRILIRSPRGQRPKVEQWLSAALELSPRHVGAWSWTAWLAAEQGGREAAEQVLRTAELAGLGINELVRIRQVVCEDFPQVCQEGADEGRE